MVVMSFVNVSGARISSGAAVVSFFLCARFCEAAFRSRMNVSLLLSLSFFCSEGVARRRSRRKKAQRAVAAKRVAKR